MEVTSATTDRTTQTMRAVVQRAYGLEHIELEDRPIPMASPGQVRIRVHAASINPADWHLATGTPGLVRFTEGFLRPKREIIGRDVCGVIDQVGAGVDSFEVGDRVFGSAVGGFAEFAVAKPEYLALAPASLSAAACAALPVAGVTALQGVEYGDVTGKRVVVNGASGGVGHYAVQIAKAHGAAFVAGVASGRNSALVRSLGADQVIDYTTEDFTAQMWDVVIDCVGSRRPSELRSCLSSEGTWIAIGAENKDGLLGPVPGMVASLIRWRFGSKTLKWFVAEETADRLGRLADLAFDGRLRTEITDTFSLDRIADAFAMIESNRTRAKLAIDVAGLEFEGDRRIKTAMECVC